MKPAKQSAPVKGNKFGPWIALLVMNVASTILLGGRFIVTRSMFWDNAKLYSVFRGNAHSLNHFGEVMWWNPTTSMGFPAFYFSHLGTDTFTPLSAAVLFVSWLLGRIGIAINDFTHLYIIYFSFLVPLLFSVAAYLLASQLFRRFYLRLLVIIMTAFSPGVVFNYSDNGLEQTSYGILFCAAFLYFYRNPSKKSFCLLVSAASIVAIAFNHLALYWNLIFIPLFMISVVVLNRRRLTAWRNAWRAVSWQGWAVGAVLAGLCLMPAAISFSQGHDILRTRNFERWYSFDYLQAGNPLELMTVSTPGIGFDWVQTPGIDSSGNPVGNNDPTNNHWTPRGYSGNAPELSFTYMGIMALPLFLVGLCYGRRPWRARLLFLTVVLTLMIMLEGWSSAFSPILLLPSPIRACNHYSDCVFRVGLFLLVIFGDALGLDAVLTHRWVHRRALPICFAASTAIGAIILISVYGRTVISEPLAGYFAAGSALFMALLFGRGRIRKNPARKWFIAGIILLIAVDVSTVSYWHVRKFMWKAQGGFQDPPPTELAMPQDDRSFYAQTLLMLRQNYNVLSSGIRPDQLGSLPGLALFDRVVKMKPTEARATDLANPQALIIDPDDPDANTYSEFTNSTGSGQVKPRSFELIKQTYNELEVKLTVDEPVVLFWRDCDFPAWHATVNGQPAKIVRAFWSFKSVKVPAGESTVRFQFTQPALFGSFLLAYGIAIGTGVMGLFTSRKQNSMATGATASAPAPAKKDKRSRG